MTVCYVLNSVLSYLVFSCMKTTPQQYAPKQNQTPITSEASYSLFGVLLQGE